MPEQILSEQGLEALPGKLAAAFGGVDALACQLLKLLHSHDNGLAVPVRGQQIAGGVCDVNTVAPVSLAGG